MAGDWRPTLWANPPNPLHLNISRANQEQGVAHKLPELDYVKGQSYRGLQSVISYLGLLIG